eukprot:7388274-Prymnesium_polylepis.2
MPLPLAHLGAKLFEMLCAGAAAVGHPLQRVERLALLISATQLLRPDPPVILLAVALKRAIGAKYVLPVAGVARIEDLLRAVALSTRAVVGAKDGSACHRVVGVALLAAWLQRIE